MTEQYLYDGTFDGFLTGIFDYYDRKSIIIEFVKESKGTVNLFDAVYRVHTDESKAERVWKGILKKIGKITGRDIYKAFLSEEVGSEKILFNVIKKGFTGQKIEGDYGDPDALQLSKIVKKVGREKHRMDAFIRFRKTKDDIYFATIEPDFNVLPLNAIHFKNRYADQKWLIYDLKRSYGVYYDMEKLDYISLEVSKDINTNTAAGFYFTEDELLYQDLWKNYFKSTNIPSRKNMKLHIQHVPKRYWKYLSEKQP
ncbi:TIGR03915 family putative DNA repair protein [Dokdonia sp. Hel_I_53]|uniref:TIGR03915 family putative DNA repair protein n=1 Tax=Dokdonia sp. Hel_I_53 TaxID=1566287 RepID=UPI00119BAE45|nr:TIGR03915 family putative DNA repair protein [Dokdonia sp. Hel_I_53]TVZ52296.1 putative DNA metabolism protein [Dokdonia sp. Hel_I_53]